MRHGYECGVSVQASTWRCPLRRALAACAAALVVSAGVAGGQANERQVRLAGRALDAQSGAPLSGTTVEITGRQALVTDSSGTFLFAGLPPGRYVVRARRVGYAEAVDTIAAHEPRTYEVGLALKRAPVELKEIVVSGRQVHYSPFFEPAYRRAASGRGYFITREMIEEWNARDYEALLNHVPTVRANNRGITFQRCQAGLEAAHKWDAQAKVQVWIDGFRVAEPQSPASVREILATVPPQSIQIMEVYPSVSSIPGDFLSDACAVIAIWTKRY